MNSTEKIVTLHGKLAKRLKQYEQITGEHPPITVLSELRYTLRAVIVILDKKSEQTTGDDPITLDNANERAIHALLCAYHDLVDGVLMELTRYMTLFTEKYTEASIEILGAKRSDILDSIKEVEEVMVRSRGNGLKRPEMYDEEIYDKYFTTLVNYKNEITTSLLPSIVNRHQELDREKHRDEEQTY